MKQLLLIALLGMPLSLYAESSALTQKQAISRKAAIGEVNYHLMIHLGSEGDHFNGIATIDFMLQKNNEPLLLDFNQGTLTSLEVNGQPQVNYTQTKKNIIIPAQDLKMGANQIKINYQQTYDPDGMGVYRFKDPTDHLTYIYTQFEPTNASQAFPCFDQPDLKAKFDLTLQTPDSWEAISSAPIKTTVVLANHEKNTIFETSSLMSSYTFSFISGPFKVWKDQYQAIPLRLMVRQSFASHVHPDEWFRLTKNGLDFFQNYFAYPYPYKKYDQIIVPDFNAGAMENIAAVTFNEKYIDDEKPSFYQKMLLTEVIYHEMAHMWFGNLVTMRWWEDLWLNESFAVFMSFQAMQHTSWLNDVALYRFYVIHNISYTADQRVTTHPIIQTIDTAEQASTQFDEITYEKGASTLQELSYILGGNLFQKGIQNYIAHYAHGNAGNIDFFKAIEEMSHKNLSDFIKKWFYTSGVNGLAVKSEYKNSKLTLSLAQSNLPLRPHATSLGFYQTLSNGVPSRYQESKQIYENAHQTAVIDSSASPEFIHVNDNDEDYVLARYSEKDWAYILKHVHLFEESLTRGMLWFALWEEVYRTHLPTPTYLTVLYQSLETEKDLLILETLKTAALTALTYIPMDTPQQQTFKTELMSGITDLAWKKLETAAADSEEQKYWVSTAIKFTITTKDQQKLYALLKGDKVIEGLVLTEPLRWSIILQLGQYNYPDIVKTIEAEKNKNNTSYSNNYAMAAFAIRPIATEKELWLSKVLSPNSLLAQPQKLIILNNLFPSSQEKLHEQFAEKIFQDMVTLNQSESTEVLGRLARAISPFQCSTSWPEQKGDFLQAISTLNPGIQKEWRATYQKEEYCIANRKLSNDWFSKQDKNSLLPTDESNKV